MYLIISGVWTVPVAGGYSVFGAFILLVATVALGEPSNEVLNVRTCACFLIVILLAGTVMRINAAEN